MSGTGQEGDPPLMHVLRDVRVPEVEQQVPAVEFLGVHQPVDVRSTLFSGCQDTLPVEEEAVDLLLLGELVEHGSNRISRGQIGSEVLGGLVHQDDFEFGREHDHPPDLGIEDLERRRCGRDLVDVDLRACHSPRDFTERFRMVPPRTQGPTAVPECWRR